MRVCTFFGHRDAPEEIKAKLSSAIEDLIVNHGVDTFYMGCEGKFDAYARSSASAKPYNSVVKLPTLRNRKSPFAPRGKGEEGFKGN